MADQFYQRLQNTASRLLKSKKQGVIKYIQPGTVTGPAYAPVQGDPVPHVLDAVANGVSQDYIDGTSIFATDKEVTAGVLSVTPTMSGQMEIDGQMLEIVRLWQVPSAGVPVAWKFICRG